MCFAVRSEGSTTVMFVIQLVAEDQFPGTKPIRNTMRNRKVVKPHDHEVQKVDDHYLWEAWVREGTDNTADALFYKADTTFNFAHVLRSGGCVERKHRKVVANLVEFIIHEDCGGCEARSGIYTDDTLEEVSKFWGSPGGDVFNRN